MRCEGSRSIGIGGLTKATQLQYFWLMLMFDVWWNWDSHDSWFMSPWVCMRGVLFQEEHTWLDGCLFDSPFRFPLPCHFARHLLNGWCTGNFVEKMWAWLSFLVTMSSSSSLSAKAKLRRSHLKPCRESMVCCTRSCCTAVVHIRTMPRIPCFGLPLSVWRCCTKV